MSSASQGDVHSAISMISDEEKVFKKRRKCEEAIGGRRWKMTSDEVDVEGDDATENDVHRGKFSGIHL